MRLLTLALLLLLAPAIHAEVNHDRLLDCIAQVETGYKARPGRAGERSVYQLTPAVWRQYRGTAYQRASAHLRWLEARMDHPTAYRLALAWNGGLGALRRPQASTLDYAKRVENLYHEK